MYVYLLESTSGKTYIGATVNMNRRLRQHNKEIKGGARYTSKWVVRGETWKHICHVSGFPTWVDALQFEWKWKHLTRYKQTLQKRLEDLNILLSSDKSTLTSTPFENYSMSVHESVD